MRRDPSNGSTEMWPGTHSQLSIAGPKPELRFTTEVLHARRAAVPPVQVVIPKGGMMVRDVRVWHRGMPNLSNPPAPRHMLGVGYNAASDPVGDPATRESNNGRRDMVFSESARRAFEAPRRAEYDLERNVVFVPGPVDPWGNQVGEVVPEQYRLAGREIFRLPTGPLPTTVLAAEEEDEEPEDGDDGHARLIKQTKREAGGLPSWALELAAGRALPRL